MRIRSMLHVLGLSVDICILLQQQLGHVQVVLEHGQMQQSTAVELGVSRELLKSTRWCAPFMGERSSA